MDSDGEYAYRKDHPVLQYLPTKLAQWIGENMQDDLGLSHIYTRDIIIIIKL